MRAEIFGRTLLQELEGWADGQRAQGVKYHFPSRASSGSSPVLPRNGHNDGDTDHVHVERVAGRGVRLDRVRVRGLSADGAAGGPEVEDRGVAIPSWR